jgi:hypothetical protein
MGAKIRGISRAKKKYERAMVAPQNSYQLLQKITIQYRNRLTDNEGAGVSRNGIEAQVIRSE